MSANKTLRCVNVANGHYSLYWLDSDNRPSKVNVIGNSATPFEIVGQWPNTPWIVVRKTPIIRATGAHRIKRLYLLNTKTGQIAPQMPYGSARIRYIEQTNSFYFDSYTNNDKIISSYSWCFERGTTYQTVNVPSGGDTIYAMKCSVIAPVTQLTLDESLAWAKTIKSMIKAVNATKPKRQYNGLPLEQLSDTSLRHKYRTAKSNGFISDELNAELSKRFETYDPINRKFKMGPKCTPVSDLADSTLVFRYQAQVRKGFVTDEVNDEMYRRFDTYDLKKRRLVGQIHRRSIIGKIADEMRAEYTKAQSNEHDETKSETPTPVPDTPKHTTVIVEKLSKCYMAQKEVRQHSDTKDYTSVGTSALLKIFQAFSRFGEIPINLHKAMIERFPEKYDPQTAQFKETSKLPSTAAQETTQEITLDENTLTAHAKLVKITQDGTFYDVYVNGNRILKNHLNTELKTFMGDTILAVHGIVTDNPNIPNRPSWQIFDTDLKSRQFDQINKYSNKKVYIDHVTPSLDDTKLTLGLSNRMNVIMQKKTLTTHVFKISHEKNH